MSEPSQFQPIARDAAQKIHLDVGERLSELANTPDLDPDLAIKIFNATKDVSQAVAEKKLDPLANLPTFNITFVNGRMIGTVAPDPTPVPPATYIDMDDSSDVESIALLPSLVMLASTNINADVIENDG
jgi:hypothetical protein